MKTLAIGGKEYVLEFSFEAAENKNCVEKIFKMVSGGYIGQEGVIGEATETKQELASALINGTASMYAEMPDTVITAFYAGLLENNPVLNKAEAKKLLKQYFKENPNEESASFFGMYELIKECMEDDGFFKLTGLDKMLAEMMKAEVEKKNPVSGSKGNRQPKKSVSTN